MITATIVTQGKDLLIKAAGCCLAERRWLTAVCLLPPDCGRRAADFGLPTLDFFEDFLATGLYWFFGSQNTIVNAIHYPLDGYL